MCVSNNANQDGVDISKLHRKVHAGRDSSSVDFLAMNVTQLFWLRLKLGVLLGG
jgi:hypothetical protein